MRIHLLLFTVTAAAQPLALEPQLLECHPAGTFRGGAQSGVEVFLWGSRLARVDLPKGRLTVLLPRVEPALAEGGCLADVDRDGQTDVIALEAPAPGSETGQMVWLAAPRWERRLVDTQAEFRDCVVATLFGRAGILVAHRQSQLRFYVMPEAADKEWSYRELYSIYTPSAQGGLSVVDVDEDGNPDVLMGNYWVQSPKRYEHHWRLFAIHNWWDEARSAMVRLALVKRPGSRFPALAAAEAEIAESRLAWFERPADPKGFWTEHPLASRASVHHPNGLAAGDFDGDGWVDLAVGENNGARSRLLLFRGSGGGLAAAGERASGPVLGLWSGTGNDKYAILLSLEQERIVVWRRQRRR